jgi:DNA/RNA-binding domain of Phe-tRNA-synthetase-like protein
MFGLGCAASSLEVEDDNADENEDGKRYEETQEREFEESNQAILIDDDQFAGHHWVSQEGSRCFVLENVGEEWLIVERVGMDYIS